MIPRSFQQRRIRLLRMVQVDRSADSLLPWSMTAHDHFFEECT
jgi:hypothetical protein